MNNFDYKNMTPFKWFVLENFPFIENDFDAINNYHLFSKVVEYLNKTIDNVNVLGNLVEQFSNYFDNLDVQEEINNKLDEMATDGTLTNLIKNYVDPIYQNYENEINEKIEQQNTNISNQNSIINSQNGKITTLESRMDNFTNLPEGSTTGDAELADGRIEWDGETAINIGTAIRNQVGNFYPYVQKPLKAGATAIKNIVFTKYVSKNLRLESIYRNAGANPVHAVILLDENNNRILLLNILSSNYTEKERNTFNVSGYQGYFDIEWSEINSGSALSFANKNYKFSNLCFPNINDYPEVVDGRTEWDGETAINIGTAIRNQVGNFYPYVQKPLKAGATAIKNIVFTKYVSKNLRLESIYRNAGANPVHAVILLDENNNRILLLNVLSSNYTEKERNTFNVSGYQGYFDIEWSEINSGSALSYADKNYKFMEICYQEQNTNNYNEIVLPSTIPVVVNREIRLEYYNALKNVNINDFMVSNSTQNQQLQNIGTALKIKTTNTDETNETISFYDTQRKLVTSATTKIKSIANEFNNNINAIFIGDSLTDQGYYLAELKRLLGNKINLLGTRQTTIGDSEGVQRTINHEGRSGWSSTDYINYSSKGNTINPFYNTISNEFDFSYYITNNPSFSSVTDVFLLLGANDSNLSSTTFINNLKSMFNSILDYNSNIRIHVMCPLPNINNGYGWGVRNYSNLISFKDIMFEFSKAIINNFDNKTGYSVIATNLNIDCWYDFPHTQVQANQRNPELITVGNNNVHPNRYGYFRMSDMIYADILVNC